MPAPGRLNRPGYEELLQDSPLLSTERANKLFPSEEERDQLKDLSAILDNSISANNEAAETWSNLAGVKDAAIKLLGLSLGKL